MFSFFKWRREKRERADQLQELGRTLGDSLNAEVALFVEIEVVPRREAFLEVLHGQIAQIDGRLKEFEAEGEVSREEAAALDVRIMLENWDKRSDEQLQSARSWLAEQYQIADAAGVIDDFDAFVQRSLNEQRLILLTGGMAAVNELADRGSAT